MSAPSIPQRPARSPQSRNIPTITGQVPETMPRPNRLTQRSMSPQRDRFALSPLNDLSFINKDSASNKPRSTSDTPARPHSVTLPSIGQEGSEYASLEHSLVDENAPHETRDAENLTLHAPTARSTARSRIAAVTRTDSDQTTAADFGRNLSPEKAQTRTGSSTGHKSRPQSLCSYGGDEEHGIPEIGLQVPMYPNAGDVQAPTPSNTSSMPATGIGYFNAGVQRNHTHTPRSHHAFHGPPESYGLHGHGLEPQDDFERRWYAKHPEDAARETQGQHGSAKPLYRKEWELSSEQLNQIVQDTATSGIAMGASSDATGTPAEEIGYLASEEYTSRLASLRLHSTSSADGKTGSPIHVDDPVAMESKHHTDSKSDEIDVIHIDIPTDEPSRIHGSEPEADKSGSGHGLATEQCQGTPILASDELERHWTPESESMQPAVPAHLIRPRPSSHNVDHHDRRAPSRPVSVAGFSHGKSSDDDHVPLDNVREYEPLFPDGDDEKKPVEQPVTAADMLRRPDLSHHHFPSQDIWEDVPSSLQLHAEVDASALLPGELETLTSSARLSEVFGKPQPPGAAASQQEQEQSFLEDHQITRQIPSRPDMQQRFPSQDIWEDAPSEHQLVAVLHVPETGETDSLVELKSASKQEQQIQPLPRPQVPSMPDSGSVASKSQVPPPAERKAPLIPERPKPQIPARPARSNFPALEGQVSVSIAGSQASPASECAPAPAAKAKPPVPSRPSGSKIAALKAGFLNDLNNRLQLGPQVSMTKAVDKKNEAEEEERERKTLLADARKGRARGPSRRRPAASPAPSDTGALHYLSLSTVQIVFSTSNDGHVEVPPSSPASGDVPKRVEIVLEEVAKEEKHVEPSGGPEPLKSAGETREGEQTSMEPTV